jgi:hypothetical protein
VGSLLLAYGPGRMQSAVGSPQINNKFVITSESCTTGFQVHVNLTPFTDVTTQLSRRKLRFRTGHDYGATVSQIKSIIDQNSSLRIAFGWSFESTDSMKEMMQECIDNLSGRFASLNATIVSDLRGDWVGFAPYNAFEKEIYDKLSVYGLIIFNNELCDFQIAVVEFITRHPTYLNHLILRDIDYRFDYFKSRRKDPIALTDAFHEVMEAFDCTLSLPYYPRRIVEEMIGCHYLHHPDTFFELLEFYKLKGKIYE